MTWPFAALATAAVGIGISACDGCGKSSGRAGEEAGEERAAPAVPEIVVLEQVTIRAVDPARAIEIFADQLGARLGEQLVTSGAFAKAAGEIPAGRRARPAALRLTITYDVVEERKRTQAIVCAIEAELDWLDGGGGLRLRENVLAERPVDGVQPGALDGLVASHIADTVEVVGRGLIAKESLRGAPDAELIAALGQPEDIDLALWALDLVGERRVSAAFDAVVALAGSADPRLRDGVVGALVALGDPRAVAPLTRGVEFTDHEELRAVVEAVSAIGGEEAVEFLEFVASGHADEDIKTRAAEGLERVQRR
jgi:hypothetical protein